MAVDSKLKHLDLIQGIINRMAQNSFLLKGWSVTLTAAIFALASRVDNNNFVVIAVFPAFMFWGLDAYFLRQERLFRCLYDKVRVMVPDEIDFSMKTDECIQDVDGWLKTAISQTLGIFHGVVLATVFLVVLLI